MRCPSAQVFSSSSRILFLGNLKPSLFANSERRLSNRPQIKRVNTMIVRNIFWCGVIVVTIPVQIELHPQSEMLLYIGVDYEETPIQSEIWYYDAVYVRNNWNLIKCSIFFLVHQIRRESKFEFIRIVRLCEYFGWFEILCLVVLLSWLTNSDRAKSVLG